MAADGEPARDRSVSVLVVCPQRLERESLALAVEQDEEMAVVGLAGDAASALEIAARRRADVFVLGWGWDAPGCLEALVRLRSGARTVPVLIVAADPDPAHVQRALQEGARGYLPASVDVDALLYAIRTMAAGDQLALHQSLAPAVFQRLAAGGQSVPPREPFASLTPREQDVVRLLAQGMADRDLAQSLFISVRTVQTHLAHIYAKLGVHTRTEVALMAVREGWGPTPDPDEGTAHGSQ